MYDLKVGDIVEIKITIEFVDEDLDNIRPDISDYDRKYTIEYNPGCFFELTEEKGFVSALDDVEEFIEEDLPKTFPEIAEYEIFDVNKKYYNEQSAKIRVKALIQ